MRTLETPFAEAPETRDEAPPRAPAGCPECGAILRHTTGCVVCGRCGYSPCE